MKLKPPMSRRDRLLLALLLVLAAVALRHFACSASVDDVMPAYDTVLLHDARYTVKVYVPRGGDTTALRAKLGVLVASRVADVDERFSLARPDSELARFNQHGSTTEAFALTEPTSQVVEKAIWLSAVTHGALDATGKAGFLYLVFDAGRHTLRKRVRDAAVDFSMLLPGITADAVARALDDNGVTDYSIRVDADAAHIEATAQFNDSTATHEATRAGVTVVHADSAMVAAGFAAAFSVVGDAEAKDLAKEFGLQLSRSNGSTRSNGSNGSNGSTKISGSNPKKTK